MIHILVAISFWLLIKSKANSILVISSMSKSWLLTISFICATSLTLFFLHLTASIFMGKKIRNKQTKKKPTFKEHVLSKITVYSFCVSLIAIPLFSLLKYFLHILTHSVFMMNLVQLFSTIIAEVLFKSQCSLYQSVLLIFDQILIFLYCMFSSLKESRWKWTAK